VRAAAIALREFQSFFRVPVGWVTTALFLFLTGVIFAAGSLEPGSLASLREFFGGSGLMLIGIAPAISMRLLSEELRTGTIEPLMTAPVGDASIIIGKYLGGALFLLALLTPTLIYPVLLFTLAEPAPDPGPIAAGYLALFLLGACYLAAGTFFSALTNNQTLAFLGTLLFLVTWSLATSRAGEFLPRPIDGWVASLSLMPRMGDFAKGIIDLTHVVFLLTVTAWFLLLSYAAIDSRRWR